MRYVVHVAPNEIRRMSLVMGDTLHIWVGANLDELAKERYIQSKLDLYGIRRRRGLIAILPFAGGHATGSSKAPTAVIVSSGVLAAGVAAAAILPFALNDGHRPKTHHPLAAAPAPTRPGAPTHRRPPAPSPSKPPGQPQAPRAAPPAPAPPVRQRLHLPVHAVPVSVTPPTAPGATPPPPKIPVPPPPHVPPPVTNRPLPLLTVSLRPVGLSVWLNPRPMVHLRIGPKLPSAGIGIRRSGSKRRGPDAEYGSTR